MPEIKLIKAGNFSVLAWDARNNYIAAFDNTSECTRVFSADSFEEKYNVEARPVSMCFDIYGRLLLCDADRKALLRNDYYGPILFAREFKGEETQPKSVLVHSSGTYFMLGSTKLYHVIPEGRGVLDASDSKDLPYTYMCMAKEEEGLIFIRNDKRIVFTAFDPYGRPQKEKVLVFGTEFGNDCPKEIITDGNGNIYCSANDKLYIFNEYGRKLDVLALGDVKGMCWSAKANLIYLLLSDGLFSMEVNN